jgi:hypothetical protein
VHGLFSHRYQASGSSSLRTGTTLS